MPTQVPSSVRHYYYSIFFFIHEQDVSVNSTHSRKRCTSFGHFVHEWHVPVHSTRSRTRSLSLGLKSKSVSEGRIRSKHSTITCSIASHTRRLLARGLVNLWQDETVHSANSWCGRRDFSERERFVHLKDFFKKNDLFTNVTSLVRFDLLRRFTSGVYKVLLTYREETKQPWHPITGLPLYIVLQTFSSLVFFRHLSFCHSARLFTERSLLHIMSRHAPYCWLATSLFWYSALTFLKSFWKMTYPTLFVH